MGKSRQSCVWSNYGCCVRFMNFGVPTCLRFQQSLTVENSVLL